MSANRFDPDALIAQACDAAGSDDFGEPDGWRDGLAQLCDGLVHESMLSDLGVEIAVVDLVGPLTNRLRITQWRKDNPAIAQAPIERPIFIVGQPRTGATILFDLLAQDPELRPPLTWEVDAPWPVPQPDTYGTDPRIEQIQGALEMSEQLVPGMMAHHPMGALLPQECVRIWAAQFCSMIFPVQYRLPSYSRWMLYDADHRNNYRYHRIFLQHLQSGVPGGPCQWLLKSPAHLWQLDLLVDEYPDAVIVQTHRDPLNVISSIASLTHHVRKMASDHRDIAECAEDCREENVVALERSMKVRDSGVLKPGQLIDVLFADFIADPFATIRTLYGALDRELKPDTEQRMRDFLAAHPGDGGGARYTWADTGLDADEVRAQVAVYQERFGVPTERLK